MTDTTLSANTGKCPVSPGAWPRVAWPVAADPDMEARIDALLAEMSLARKVGQIIQADISFVTPQDVRELGLGSVLNGGNSKPNNDLRARPQDWLELADALWDAALEAEGPVIPLIWGTDAVHGHSNVVGATIFPHNIGLGATRNPALVERIGAATAMEVSLTGMDWSFSPTVAVARDDRWGRAYEAFSEDPTLVADLGAAYVRGMQGTYGTPDYLSEGRILACVKHFLGDGGTRDGRDQGETVATEDELRDIHAAGYVSALEEGVATVMASFSSWGGVKLHGRGDVLDGLLKRHWGFDGLVVGDWNGHGQVEGCTTEHAPAVLNAGLDMFMAPDSFRGLHANTMEDVRAGRVSMARLDDAVRRVLRLKVRYGVFDKPNPSKRAYAGQFGELGGRRHTEVAREAVRQSAVLLTQRSKLLPVDARGKHVLVAGGAANDLGQLCGGWTLSWQGEGIERSDFPGAQTLLEGLEARVSAVGGTVEHSTDASYSRRPDVAVVVFGELPYAEFRGDLPTLDYKPGDDSDYAMLRALKAEGIPTIAVFLSGRPLWVNPALNAAGAFIAAFLPGTQAGALADLLIAGPDGRPIADFTGKLPSSWPHSAGQFRLNEGEPGYDPLFPIGHGLGHGDVLDLEPLHEEGLDKGENFLTLFDKGAARGGWSITLADMGGETGWAMGKSASPAGALVVKPADLGQQENAIALSFEKSGASLVFTREPVDLSREANGDFVLVMEYARGEAMPSPVSLTIGEVTVDISALLLPGAPGMVRRLVLPLKRFSTGTGNLARASRLVIKAGVGTAFTMARLDCIPVMGAE